MRQRLYPIQLNTKDDIEVSNLCPLAHCPLLYVILSSSTSIKSPLLFSNTVGNGFTGQQPVPLEFFVVNHIMSDMAILCKLGI